MGEGRRQETGDRRQETGEMGMSEEVGVGVRIVRMIFLPNYAPKIRSFLSVKS
ncbi:MULTISPECIES: hypothetical protein [unclassified Okeania]|uniref:hypothetical protein n=1 Tax=unclassified Okeania TaxID=2634635 RepID=UPI0013BA41FE|nr:MULTISPECIES: hypothetical protein [unclassified Okeania]NES76553.1 hypothetical protein [Okeania sp. SIO1H4]NET20257.1 hypothetical protein [Okeania sp. SIO1H5]NET96406.1 hypothetical protein [Okeania sp. SIO1H2]